MLLRKAITSSLFSGSAVYLFSNLAAAAIPFALLPVLTRYLTPAEYGQVAIFQTLLAGLGAFIGISAQGAAGVKYYDSSISNEEFKFYIGSCFLVLGITTSIALGGFLFFKNEISAWLTMNIEWILLGILAASAAFVISIRMGQWQIRKQARSFGVFQISQSLINMLFSLLLVTYFLQGSAGRIWVLALVPVFFSAIALYSLQKDGLIGFAWRPAYFRDILAFGIPLIPHTVGLFLLGSIDRFIINDKLGLIDVGIYMVAVQLAAVMGLAFDAINNAYVPWLYERLKRNQIQEKIQIVRLTYIYCAVLLFIVTITFFIGPGLLVLIAGNDYSPAGEIIGWLALGQAFHGMYLMVTNYIFYSKRTGLLSLSTVAAGLIHVGLLMMMLNLMGLKGVAIAYAVSMAIKFLMTWFVANLRYPMPWFNLKAQSQVC